jgi:polygalacturonase
MNENKSFFNILDYGAQKEALSTAQIQAAIDAACAVRGGVLIPSGTFMSGTVNLKGVSLYLEKGAVLKGSPDINDYPFYGFVHNEMGNVLSLLYCKDSENVSISGEGTIDLSGGAFFDFNRRSIPSNSKVPFTEKQIAECTVCYEQSPNKPILFRHVKRLTIRGIRITDAPCWTMSFIECEDIKVSDLTIDNDLSIPNNDGMHFVCCKDVIVRACTISTGDDCIAMTGITDWNKPTERIIISDCLLRSCSKAISIGYMHSIVRDITITNCIVRESNRAVVLMASAGTGLIENVTISNLRLDTRIRAGNWWGNGEPVCIMGTWHNHDDYRDSPPEKRFSVSIRNVLFQNLICSGENVIAVIGENKSVRDIYFDRILFELKDSDNLALKGRTVDLSPGTQIAQLPDNGIPYWLFIKDAESVEVQNAVALPFHGQTPEKYVV